jgi:DNA-binding NtrC family response regulator
LLNYAWPGNVRELQRLVERAVAMATSDVIDLDDLPPTVRGDYDLALMPALKRRDTLRAWATRYARLVLDRCGGNKREAARVLGISYHTLIVYLRQDEATLERANGWHQTGGGTAGEPSVRGKNSGGVEA